MGVTGWVRNTPGKDSVDGEAQHQEKKKLDEFVKVRIIMRERVFQFVGCFCGLRGLISGRGVWFRVDVMISD